MTLTALRNLSLALLAAAAGLLTLAWVLGADCEPGFEWDED